MLTNSAGEVTITGGTVTTNASGANGLFATGTGSSVTMSNGTITTTGNASHGIDVTYGDTQQRQHLDNGTGTATFTVNGGSINATAGDLFFIVAESGSLTANITLKGGATVGTSTGYIVDATASSTANFVADGETLTGNFMTDSTSSVSATLQNGTTLTGFFNAKAAGTESLFVDATSTWNANRASTLSSVTNNGTFAFATDGLTVDVAGAYTQANTGKLVVVLDGTTAGTNYDQIAVTGKATLAGVLEVNAASGFTPTVGETFNFLTYGSESGSFASLTSNSGLTYTVNYGSTEATIIITAVSSATAAPTITTQPASADAAVGTSVAFSVVASGSGTLGYQWYKDGTAISGATSASYTVAAAKSTDIFCCHR